MKYLLLVLVLLIPARAWAEVGDGGPDDPGAGHRAGYRWAERHDIDDPDDCRGCPNCTSFRAGCKDYAEEQAQEKKDQRAEDDEDEE